MKYRYFFSFLGLVLLLQVFLALNVCTGSVNIPLKEVISIFRAPIREILFWIYGGGSGSTSIDIVLLMRLPRALAAMLLGGGLALSGYLLQTFFRNPIAGPFTLGTSSGAKLAVAMVMVFAFGSASHPSSALMIAAAFVGAIISMGFVLLMSRLIDQMSVLIVSGVMIGYICSAITDLVVTFADDANIVNLHNWSRGSFSGISWSDVRGMAGVILVTSALVFLLSKPISAYQLGEEYARSVGLNVRLFRGLLVVLSSVLSACVTAFAGPISFVGVAVPQLVKRLFGTARPILMIPACFLGGAVFCLFCDLLARTCFAPTELSISTVTAIFGAPVVIVVLLRRKLDQGA